MPTINLLSNFSADGIASSAVDLLLIVAEFADFLVAARQRLNSTTLLNVLRQLLLMDVQRKGIFGRTT
jgi:DNA polymerase III delta subunit